MTLPERERQDRRGRGAPDTGQRRHGVEVPGERAAVFVDDLPGRGMQVARPGVVAEAGPQVQYLVLRR